MGVGRGVGVEGVVRGLKPVSNFNLNSYATPDYKCMFCPHSGPLTSASVKHHSEIHIIKISMVIQRKKQRKWFNSDQKPDHKLDYDEFSDKTI